MKFSTPLTKVRLINRYKRFLADVQLKDGTVMTVHCPNPGSMMGIKESDSIAWISCSDNPRRKLSHTLELVQSSDTGSTLVGVNTNIANKIVEEIILSRRFAEFGEFDTLQREVKYGENSRIDFLLSGNNVPDAYVEVKSVTLQRQKGLHEFPDSPSERGRKHLNELAKVANSNKRAILIYLIQRCDGDRFSCARDIDPLYAQAFDEAVMQGVETFAIRCKISSEEIIADKIIEIDEPMMRQMK